MEHEQNTEDGDTKRMFDNIVDYVAKRDGREATEVLAENGRKRKEVADQLNKLAEVLRKTLDLNEKFLNEKELNDVTVTEIDYVTVCLKYFGAAALFGIFIYFYVK